MSKTIPPLRVRAIHYEGVEDQLLEIFRELLFLPLLDQARAISPSFKLENAEGGHLTKAIKEGTVTYADGVFRGKFSARIGSDISAMGGVFDKRSGVWRVPVGKVPGWVQAVVAERARIESNAVDAMRKAIEKAAVRIEDAVQSLDVKPNGVIEQIDKDTAPLAFRLGTVDPHLTPQGREAMEKAYTDNMRLWVKKFSEEQIVELRKDVSRNAEQGFRAKNLVSDIKARYDVTENKARFLARQETALFMAQYRQQKFKAAGVTRYIWSTSHDGKVRPRHRELDKREFRYDEPPVVDQVTGRRANPGEDFNCRCADIPILEMDDTA